MEHVKNTFKLWHEVLEKYAVSALKQESSIEVMKAWNWCKLTSKKVDPDGWVITLYDINDKFIKIKKEDNEAETQLKVYTYWAYYQKITP